MRLDHLLSKETMLLADKCSNITGFCSKNCLILRVLGSSECTVVKDGGLAQLGERLPCTQEVSGSIPLISTNSEVMAKW